MIILTIWKIFELKRKLKVAFAFNVFFCIDCVLFLQWYFAKRGWRWGKAILGKAKDYYDEKLEGKSGALLDNMQQATIFCRKRR